MDDLKVDITPPSNKSSEDDPLRRELLWEKREEQLLLKWCDSIKQKAIKHKAKALSNKKMYHIISIPVIIIPLVIGGINGLVDVAPIAFSILMIFSSILAGVNTFFNFSKKSTIHFEFESKYNELGISIEKELAIPKTHRIAADVYLERIQQSYNHLNNYAPD
jgi:hypothetical protein